MGTPSNIETSTVIFYKKKADRARCIFKFFFVGAF
jgi:hypothetical protein